MDSTQISTILKQNRQTARVFRGCFASDLLPSPLTLQYPAALIVNRDPHHKEGTHWCAIYARGLDAPVFYYDSIAQPIPAAITSSFLSKF
uniref:Cysteine protease n=1 Tax=Globodera rostochiensis TaxID=31243 RepID=A0A914GSA6_GLORO